MKTAMVHAFERAVSKKKESSQQNDKTLTICVSDFHQHLKEIVKMLDRGIYIDLQAQGRKVGMIVPY